MKKISLSIALALMAATAGFAETAMTVPQQLLVGTIKSVATDKLVLADAAGKEVQVMMSSKTTVWDKAGKALTADKLAAGEKVDVKWAGNHEASSIRIES